MTRTTFDIAGFVAENRGKMLRTWSEAGQQGILVLSRGSCLRVPHSGGEKDIGLHLVASYDHTIRFELSRRAVAVLLHRATLEAIDFVEACEIPGEMFTMDQEYLWGSQKHLHRHFGIALVTEVRAAGYEPVRYVEWQSRLRATA
ncbi:hypothetical protein A3D66_00195 [Candidatus Kaiserbacteria bacterium RIFCSPHIGHO2_02_FULL_50_9]|uniref:Uncharacterized protein n=1 Tax=Candidatus Kaiserbacteria bacterium RIFCSPLOWO2_01_FULL_51_21 TaxID=1798508 RepID=A0A1F6EDH0_9BACT|nr:MAG: hypothetical protein A2761_00435 [Candidatus Kaiserbacteria bacterium RIFCSPHIGHO2_01_FULL_51_33]OGG63126.1 MAG: hypothetical protein A3D66_00195 [Candidatus Kaiserbacteria bacterium RIFCSPHIGHO2_02_FULL_50_9]OGG71725.1 MAG: hypothetical protein A3A35_01860 [Candidatus Kaiserbacteria bacterium RIFCSPLOWO2_01_FULL_51_21]